MPCKHQQRGLADTSPRIESTRQTNGSTKRLLALAMSQYGQRSGPHAPAAAELPTLSKDARYEGSPVVQVPLMRLAGHSPDSPTKRIMVVPAAVDPQAALPSLLCKRARIRAFGGMLCSKRAR
jgi:hypothetical protein